MTDTASTSVGSPAVHPLDESNRRLLAHTHPPDWRNPQPTGRYNLLVVGGGPAGLVAAAGAAGLGAKVAMVEKHLLGGDCLIVGCVPSKALIRAARAAFDVRDSGRFGVRGGADAQVDFGAAMARMRELRAGLSAHDSAARFTELGIDVYLGAGRFASADSFEIDGRTLRFSRACISTGARAFVPPVEGLAEVGFLTNETVFSLTELPRRLSVIGAGPIGCELAQAFARFGSEVWLIEMAEQILIREDREAAQIVERALERDGVKIALSSKLARVSRGERAKVLHIESPDGARDIAVDEVLIGVGRLPNVEQLGLEAAGVEYDRTGIQVDARLRTSNKQIFAAGDVCSRFKFTHTADAMARIVIGNALFFGRGRSTALTVPWCTYTDPEIAHVGKYQHELEGIPFDSYRIDLASVDRAVLDGETDGFVKVLCKKGSDKILGATIVARHAGDMISEVTVAMANGLGLKAIGNAIHPYPTQAEALKKAADAYNRTRLTPLVAKLFGALLAWRR